MRALLYRSLVSAALVALLAGAASAAATITIINIDGPGEGFNDATAAAPVGGNAGLTVGQQRLNCFQEAANIWGSHIDSPVPILIRSAFNPLTCTATSAVLGSAGPRFVEASEPEFEFQNVWYHEALACKETGVDLVPPGAAGTGRRRQRHQCPVQLEPGQRRLPHRVRAGTTASTTTRAPRSTCSPCCCTSSRTAWDSARSRAGRMGPT
jgi:hypothetical protein